MFCEDLWSEGLGARPLHSAPFEQVKQTKHKGEKRLDFILLLRFYFYSLGIVGFAGDKMLLKTTMAVVPKFCGVAQLKST